MRDMKVNRVNVSGSPWVKWPGLIAVCLATIWIVPKIVGPDNYPLLSNWTPYALLALSLAWVWGKAGVFSFGQPLFFGIGAYAYGAASINMEGQQFGTVVSLATALLIGGFVAGLLGYFMFYGRVSNLAVGIVTLAATLTAQTAITATSGGSWKVGSAPLGGENGMTPIPLPSLPGVGDLDIEQLYLLNAFSAAAVLLLLIWLSRRPMGRIAAAVRENEERSELLGYDVRWEKLRAFIVGGLVAGFGGGLFAGWSGIAYPSVFSLSQMALVVVWVLIGGRGSLIGPFVAVFLVQLLNHKLSGGSGLPAGTSQLILGLLMIVFVLVLPGGGASAAKRLWMWLSPARRDSTSPYDAATASLATSPPLVSDDDEPRAMTLAVQGLGKSFGRLRAVDDLDLEFGQPSLYPIIGPNGAGKSTLFGLLLGRVEPSSGDVLLDGVSIAREPIFRRVRRGLGGKLQQPSLFPELSVQENLWLAIYSRVRHSRKADDLVPGALAQCNLVPDATRPARDLAHGQQQWLEIAMVLARRPQIVLLDEPTAGMSLMESMVMGELVKELARTCCVIVVAHDMPFVSELGQTVTVLDNGKLFASARMEELREHTGFLDIYLGRGAHV